MISSLTRDNYGCQPSKFPVPLKTFSNSTSSEDISYWLTQCKEQVIIGFNNAKQAWPIWVVLHSTEKGTNQTLCLFEESDSDDQIISQMKTFVHENNASAIFHAYPSKGEEGGVFLTFISESKHLKKEETFKVKTDNLEISLEALVKVDSMLVPYFFERSNEDLC